MNILGPKSSFSARFYGPSWISKILQIRPKTGSFRWCFGLFTLTHNQNSQIYKILIFIKMAHFRAILGDYERSRWTSKTAHFIIKCGHISSIFIQICGLKLIFFGRFIGPKDPQIDPKNALFFGPISCLEPNSLCSIWVQKVKGVNSVLGGKGKDSYFQPQITPLTQVAPHGANHPWMGGWGSTIQHNISQYPTGFITAQPLKSTSY